MKLCLGFPRRETEENPHVRVFESLLDDELVGQFDELIPMFAEYGHDPLEGSFKDTLDRRVDAPGRVLGIVLVLGDFLAY